MFIGSIQQTRICGAHPTITRHETYSLFRKMHTFQTASLLVFALVFSQICWIYVIYFFKKIMHFDFVYISTYLGNMLVIE